MADNPVADLKPFTGTFQWSHAHFHKAITKEYPSYDSKDPKTWPSIKKPDHLDFGDHKTKSLPGSVAYDETWNEEFANNSGLEFRARGVFVLTTSGVDDEKMNHRFRHYPYNFDKAGKLRDRACLPVADYEIWMRCVHGEDKKPKEEPPERSSASSIELAENESIENSTSHFERIMQFVSERKAATQDFAALIHKLEEARTQLQDEQAMSEKLEIQVSELETNLSGAKSNAYDAATNLTSYRSMAKKNWDKLSDMWSEENEKANSAKKKLGEVEAELKSMTEERDQAVKETGEVRAQMEKIWKEIASMEQAGAKKRQSEEYDLDDKSEKKPKMI